jgi:hypothetical protein
MSNPGYEEIRGALQRAECTAWDAIGKGGQTADEVHACVSEALKLVESLLFPAGGCAGPDCSNAVPDKGIGRPALYCSARCRDRAKYRARKQRAQRGA